MLVTPQVVFQFSENVETFATPDAGDVEESFANDGAQTSQSISRLIRIKRN